MGTTFYYILHYCSDLTCYQDIPSNYQEKIRTFPYLITTYLRSRFRKGREIRGHIANLRWMMETVKEHNRNVYMCFIDYKKAFDCVYHERLCVIIAT